jgi:hypothetical protein
MATGVCRSHSQSTASNLAVSNTPTTNQPNPLPREPCLTLIVLRGGHMYLVADS